MESEVDRGFNYNWLLTEQTCLFTLYKKTRSQAGQHAYIC